MPYLVDGHNLIPKTPGLTLGAIDVENHLIEILRAFCQNRKTQIEVYFDRAPIGQAGTKRFGAVKAIFVRTGKTADHAIRDRLHAIGKSARNWTVVSSDRQVQAEARAIGASVLPSESFSQQIQEAALVTDETNEDISISSGEVDEWLQLFGRQEPDEDQH